MITYVHVDRWGWLTRALRGGALSTAAIVILAGAWLAFLRPQTLGGPVTYVLVRGTSMLPTYDPGDLIIVRRHSDYAPGDAVSYRVPEGEPGAGLMVLHRIIGGDGAAGFVARGDNNASDDGWRPKTSDVVGKEWVRIPRAGRVFALARSPLVLASLLAGIAVAFVIVPDQGSTKKKGEETR